MGDWEAFIQCHYITKYLQKIIFPSNYQHNTCSLMGFWTNLCRLRGLPVRSHPGRVEVSLSKTPNPRMLLTSWLAPCMAANRRWCVNVCVWMRGINCTVLWIKALYKCSPLTIRYSGSAFYRTTTCNACKKIYFLYIFILHDPNGTLVSMSCIRDSIGLSRKQRAWATAYILKSSGRNTAL